MSDGATYRAVPLFSEGQLKSKISGDESRQVRLVMMEPVMVSLVIFISDGEINDMVMRGLAKLMLLASCHIGLLSINA